MGNAVALKVFKDSSYNANLKVEEETKMMMQLKHPNIITCYGYTKKDRWMMIVMQNGGKTLDRYIIEKYNGNDL